MPFCIRIARSHPTPSIVNMCETNRLSAMPGQSDTSRTKRTMEKSKVIALSSQHDNILVEFEMPNSAILWWSALIEDIYPHSTEDGVQAIPSVRYDDRYDK